MSLKSKKIAKTFFILCFGLFYSCQLDKSEDISRVSIPFYSVQETSPNLILTNLQDPAPLREQHPRLGVQSFPALYGGCIDGNRNGDWQDSYTDEDGNEVDQRAKLEYCLREEKIPNDFDGYVMIDWEFRPFLLLVGLEEEDYDGEFQFVLNNFISLLAYIKERKPHAQLGYFNLPFGGGPSRYGGGTQGREIYRQNMLRLMPLLEAVDVFMPAIYDSTCGNLEQDKINDEWMIQFNLEISHGLGDKPVIPYTWHRYHYFSSSGDCDFQIIPEEEHVGLIKHLWENAEFNQRKISGFVTWGATQWYCQQTFCRNEDGTYCNNGLGWDHKRTALRLELPDESCEYINDYAELLHSEIYRRLQFLYE